MGRRVYRTGMAAALASSTAVLTLLLIEQTGGQQVVSALTQSWPDWAKWMAVCLAGYLLGSIPFGYIIIGILRERDLTSEGSGRTGGTNAMRAGGLGAGALTVAGDVFKGMASVAFARAVMPGGVWAEVLAGWGAVLGHNASIYVGFRGGAGSGPNMGVAGAFWPPSLIPTLACFPISMFVIRYASVGSILIAAVVVAIFAVRTALGDSPIEYVWYGLGAMALVLYALRPNIERLLKGTEKPIALPNKK